MRLLLLLGVAACAVDLPPSDIDGLDLIVGPTEVTAYLGLTDAWASNDPRFARPGECAEGDSDAIGFGPSCFEGLEIDGVALQDSGYPANPWHGGSIAADASLKIVACGRTVELALHATDFPVITNLMATTIGNDLSVTWSAREGNSILLGVSNTGGLYNCHLTNGTEHVFTGRGASGPLQFVEARALRPPEITETALGQVRVWYGDKSTIIVEP